MKNYIIFFYIFLSSFCFADQNWQQHWHTGRDLCYMQQYQEAATAFDLAVNVMSESEQEQYPYVLIDRAELFYFLKEYSKAFLDTEKVIHSIYLTEEERLTCALRRISILSIMGNENAAIEEYKKYIIPCTLFPKYDFSKEKIIIRNVLDCNCYKDFTKKIILSEFCEKEEDIHVYGNTWIINITKGMNCSACKNDTGSITDPFFQNTHIRTPTQIQACCNTVNKMAVASSVICGCISVPIGPITSGACKLACVVFVEEIRQICEWCCYNGGVEEKCWKRFETWKTDFKNANPKCPQPPKECS